MSMIYIDGCWVPGPEMMAKVPSLLSEQICLMLIALLTRWYTMY